MTILCKMVAHLSALLLPAIIAFYAIPAANLFSLHPTLMTLGFSLLMLEGIVIFSKSSSLFPNANRPWKASVHYWLMGLGVTCVAGGFAAIYVNKERKGSEHFTSWHGLIGVMTVGYSCAQSMGGAIAKYYRYLSTYIKVKLVDLKLYHATSGLLLYLLATVSLILGLLSNWANKVMHEAAWYVCLALVSSAGLIVMTHVTSTFLPKAQNKERTTTDKAHRPVTRSQKSKS